jgi:hypothetical protein
MSGTETAPRGGKSFLEDLAVAAPVIWLCANLLLTLRGLWQGWPTALAGDLPGEIALYVQGGLAAGIVQLVLGIYVLGLAWRRSPRFPFWFTLWASLAIAFDILFLVASFLIGAFVASWLPWLVAAMSVALSAWTIALVRRHPEQAPAARPLGPAGAGALVLWGILGFVVGGGAGLGGGLLAGSVIVDWLDVSCFEGGCGYAAAAIGLLGLVVGAIGGAIFAIVRVRRQRAAA